MKNAVGREIPDELLKDGKEVYQGKYYMDGKPFKKAGPRTIRHEKPQESKIDVVVPMDDGVELTYFNASFIPNGKVEDTTSGQSVTLREAFGQSASDGVLTFNSDGTFRDTLISGEHNQGAYVVQNHIIHATYTNDKNMIIDVVEWDGDTPVRFTVLYGDFLVYFGKGD